ncbi:GAF domain-containing protein [Pseudomonas sp. NPDC088429]|uniref:GAF domain-containing protein n=1 Tax=Pseudomonas sp. NPDC088429 TaxID=3364455 RepID=UPI003801A1F0
MNTKRKDFIREVEEEVSVAGILQRNEANKRNESKILDAVFVLVNVWNTLFAPIIIGVLITHMFLEYSKKPDVSLWDALSAYISANLFISFSAFAFISLHVFLNFILYRMKETRVSSYDVAVLNERLDINLDEVDAIQGALENISSQRLAMSLVVEAMDDFVEAYLAYTKLFPSSNLLSLKMVEYGLASMMSSIVHGRHEIFGFSGKSYYNMAVYVYSESHKELAAIWRSCDNRIATTGRRWKPGIGHVGLAFVQNKVKFCDDITKSDASSHTQTAKDDQKYYRSFISQPISITLRDAIDNKKVGDKVVGVLVFTSSEPKQFDLRKHQQFTFFVSKVISMYFSRLDCFNTFVDLWKEDKKP